MANKVLEKIEGTIYKTTLEHKKSTIKRFKEMELTNDAEAISKSVAGYLQAMRDCGVITDRERQWLYIYYGSMC